MIDLDALEKLAKADMGARIHVIQMTQFEALDLVEEVRRLRGLLKQAESECRGQCSWGGTVDP